jgi:hypothetical protein
MAQHHNPRDIVAIDICPLVGFSPKPRCVSNFLLRITKLESASNPHHSEMSFLAAVISRHAVEPSQLPTSKFEPYSFSKLPTIGRVTKSNILQRIDTYLTAVSIQAWIKLHLQMGKCS